MNDEDFFSREKKEPPMHVKRSKQSNENWDRWLHKNKIANDGYIKLKQPAFYGDDESPEIRCQFFPPNQTTYETRMS